MSLSFLISALSLLPYTNRGEFRFKRLFFPLYFNYKVPVGSTSKDDLILVHEDIVMYDFSGYRKKLSSHFQEKNIDNQHFKLMSDMIPVNARIWNIKFRFFKLALFIDFVGFALVLIGLIEK